jgi:hypothetical protein
VVADRAEGAGKEFHDGTLHRRQNAEVQSASFWQQRLQQVHGRQARARERIERPTTYGEADKVIT